MAAVAGALDDAAVMDGDCRVDQIAAQRSQPRKDAILVGAGKPAVADDIGHQDRREFPGLAHRAPLGVVTLAQMPAQVCPKCGEILIPKQIERIPVPLKRRTRLQPKSAFSCFPLVQRADLKGSKGSISLSDPVMGVALRGRFAPLAVSRVRSDGIVIARSEATRRSRAAASALHLWIASLTLAMTTVVRPNRIVCYEAPLCRSISTESPNSWRDSRARRPPRARARARCRRRRRAAARSGFRRVDARR